MENVFNWFPRQDNTAEKATERKITEFFTALHLKQVNQQHAILDAIKQFEAEPLLRVIRRLQSEYQCCIDQQDGEGNSALHIMAQDIRSNPTRVYTKLQSLYYLVEAGINPNLQDKQQDTVLHLLMRHIPKTETHHYVDCIHYFIIQKKVDLTIKNKFDNTAFHELVQYSDELMTVDQNSPLNINIVRFFIQLASDSGYLMALKRAKNIDGNSLLHIAAIHGQPKTVQCLLETKWDVNTRNKEGVTPLHYAILGTSTAYVEVVKQLLATESININIRIKELGKNLGYTPADIVECIFRCMMALTNDISTICTHTCAINYQALSKHDNNTLQVYESPIYDSPIEDVKQELKQLGENLYYTGSQVARVPSLYIKLNTRNHAIDACYQHIEDTKNRSYHHRGFSGTIIRTIWGSR